MQRPIAKRVNDLMIEFSDKLNTSVDEVRKHASPEEFNRYRRAVQQILATMFTEIMAPIFSEHPDLVPENISRGLGPSVITGAPESAIRSKSHVPQDKFDLERADKLESLDQTELQQIAPDLLVWLRDMNWPVAGRVARALTRVGQPIVPLLREVLQGTDEMWKYWCIGYLITELPTELAVQLRPELSRIADHQTEGEKAAEVEEVAREAFVKVFGGHATDQPIE